MTACSCPSIWAIPAASTRRCLAAALAKGAASEVHVLTVVPTAGMAVVGSSICRRICRQGTGGRARGAGQGLEAKRDLCSPAKLKGHVAKGSVYQEIMHAADALKCDAIVMTAHSPDLKDYLLGPNAARVVRHANQSVMVIRGEG
jgi:nucleotide-binding universal stress UspA family protein